jgi:putative oxygen-independent coproporphyrinogen III oxidase
VPLLNLPPLALYIHVPWCLRKCPYCDFNSHAADKSPDAEDYVRVLLSDLELELGYVQGRRIETVFIGGGTPSLFQPEVIQALLHGIGQRVELDPDAEITLEANPGTAEAERFQGYRQAGVNRLSVGIQSFDGTLLQRLGRIHDGDQAMAAVEMAESAGFERINLDLMFGLPGQSLEMALNDVERALSFGTEHLSYYQLTLEPNTLFAARPPRLPEEDLIADIQEQGHGRIRESGLQHYEISAFSRSGGECRHNLNYWRFGDYIGIGAGAHAKLSDLDGAVRRRWRVRHPDAYLASAGTDAAVAGERILGPGDLVAEFMLNALRLQEGFALELFRRRTGLELAVLEPALAEAVEMELVEIAGGRLLPTERGRTYLNDLIGLFLPE